MMPMMRPVFFLCGLPASRPEPPLSVAALLSLLHGSPAEPVDRSPETGRYSLRAVARSRRCRHLLGGLLPKVTQGPPLGHRWG